MYKRYMQGSEKKVVLKKSNWECVFERELERQMKYQIKTDLENKQKAKKKGSSIHTQAIRRKPGVRPLLDPICPLAIFAFMPMFCTCISVRNVTAFKQMDDSETAFATVRRVVS